MLRAKDAGSDILAPRQHRVPASRQVPFLAHFTFHGSASSWSSRSSMIVMFRFAHALFTITFPRPERPLSHSMESVLHFIFFSFCLQTWDSSSKSYYTVALFLSTFHCLLCCNTGNRQAKLRNSASPFSMHQARE